MYINTKKLLSIIGIGLLIYLIWKLKILLVYLFISIVLSLIISPIAGFFHRRKIWKWHLSYSISVVLAMLLITAPLILFINIFLPMLIEQSKVIMSIQPELVINQLQAPITEFESFIKEYRIIELNGKTTTEYIQDELLHLIPIVNIANVITGMFSAIGNVFIAVFSVIFISFFFIKDRDLFIRMVYTFTPNQYIKQIKQILRNTKKLLRRYFIGIMIQVSAIILLVTVGLSIIGIENAFAIGFFAGVINIIPYVGPLIGTLFGVALSYTTNIGIDMQSEMIPLIIKVLSVFALVHLIDNFVFQPLIFSTSVRSHPLEIFFVIMAAAIFAGIPGMILAVPTYTFIRIIAKEFFSGFKVIKVLTKDI